MEKVTYIVKVSLHMYECESLLQEEDQKARWHLIGVEFVIVQVRFLSKTERSVIESYQGTSYVSETDLYRATADKYSK